MAEPDFPQRGELTPGIPPLGPAWAQQLAKLRRSWGWFVALGVVLLLLGLLALIYVVASTVVSIYYIGALMLISGVLHIAEALRVRQSWKPFLYWLLSGVLYTVAAILSFVAPLAAATALTFVFALALAVAGVMRLIAGIHARPVKGWGWIIVSGLVSLGTGILLALMLPLTALVLPGLFLAIDLTVQGVTTLMFGIALKKTTQG